MTEPKPGMPEAVIDIENASWMRGDTLILRSVNWRVRPGEHWAIVGLNGSGKTTLLNMINGYIWPTKGRVSVLGRPFGSADLRALRQAIGWVSSHLQEQLPGGDKCLRIVLSGKYATIGLFDQPSDHDIEKAFAIMAELGCEHLADRPYRSCSQGEKQRLLIGRALMAAPRLLILDEPCNGLDLFAREQMLSAIQCMGSQAGGPTLLYVTHYIEEIMPVFSHTLLMRAGASYFAGRTRDALATNRLTDFFGIPVDVSWSHDRARLFIF